MPISTKQIAVCVCKPKGKAYYQCVWIDPATGRQRRRSSKCNRRRDAERVADELAEELNAGVRTDIRRWEDFCQFYERHHMANLASSTQADWRTVKREVLATLDPRDLRDISTPMLTRFATSLRDRGLAEATVGKYLATLIAALNWAKSQLLIAAVPMVPRARRVHRRTKMKSRPITGEEFDRMLLAIEKVVELPEYHQAWEFFLQGLWLGGFRLGEMLDLWWDRPDKLMPLIDTRRPTMAIHAELEKGDRDRPHYPLAPEFAELLRTVPPELRVGPVFNVGLHKPTRSITTIGRAITAIGKAAGVAVGNRVVRSDIEGEPPTMVPKFATAHDLRRSFATRWAMRVKPLVLKELMRHASIATTEAYYIAFDSEEVGDVIWEAAAAADRIARPDRSSSTVAAETGDLVTTNQGQL